MSDDEHEEIRRYIRDNDKRIESLEQKTNKNWNLIQELAQEILPNQLEPIEEKVRVLEQKGKNNDYADKMSYDSLQKEIAELRDLEHRIGDFTDLDFINIKEEIAELKKLIETEIYNRQHNFTELRGVLRDLHPLLKTIDYNNNMWNQAIFNKKLDAVFKKLGGETTEVLGQDDKEVRVSGSASSDSKPSETNRTIRWVCKECGYDGNSRDIVCPECHNSLFKRLEKEPTDDLDDKNMEQDLYLYKKVEQKLNSEFLIKLNKLKTRYGLSRLRLEEYIKEYKERQEK